MLFPPSLSPLSSAASPPARSDSSSPMPGSGSDVSSSSDGGRGGGRRGLQSESADELDEDGDSLRYEREEGEEE